MSDRAKYLGASEAAAVLGLSPYASAADVFWTKRPDLAGVPTPPEQRDTPATARGRILEPALLDHAERELGVPMQRQLVVVAPDGIMRATLDAAALDARPDPVVVEAKTSRMTDGWGPQDTDCIPAPYYIQCMAQMHCVPDAERVWVYACVAGDIRRYCVHRDRDTIARMADALLAWWHRHVVAGVPPDNAPPPAQLLERVARRAGTSVTLHGQASAALTQLAQLRAQRREIDSRIERLEGVVLAAMGDAQAAITHDGGARLDVTTYTRRDIDRNALRTQHPDIWAACMRTSQCTRIRVGGATIDNTPRQETGDD